jgi:hypothetical protein
MFVTLRQYGYVHKNVTMGLCLSHYDDREMFITLRCYYVCHVTLPCLSHCDNMAMFIILQQWGYVPLTATVGIYWDVTMFVIL